MPGHRRNNNQTLLNDGNNEMNLTKVLFDIDNCMEDLMEYLIQYETDQNRIVVDLMTLEFAIKNKPTFDERDKKSYNHLLIAYPTMLNMVIKIFNTYRNINQVTDQCVRVFAKFDLTRDQLSEIDINAFKPACDRVMAELRENNKHLLLV